MVKKAKGKGKIRMKETDQGVKWFNTIYYPNNKVFGAVHYEDRVLPRLRKNKVVLFTPWGPRYSSAERGVEIESQGKEIEVLRFLSDMIACWKARMGEKEFSWIFLGADLYGTRINPLNKESISDYFEWLRLWLSDLIPEATFRLWSEFDIKAEAYRQEVVNNFDSLSNPGLLERAERTAKAMGFGSSGKDYLVERFAEATLMEEKFEPIKISCVHPSKDATVDLKLPRLYLLPDKLLAPWL